MYKKSQNLSNLYIRKTVSLNIKNEIGWNPTQLHMVTWVEVGLKRGVTPRSSQGHSKVKSTKKSKIYMFFTNSVNLEVYVMVEPRLDLNMELY